MKIRISELRQIVREILKETAISSPNVQQGMQKLSLSFGNAVVNQIKTSLGQGQPSATLQQQLAEYQKQVDANFQQQLNSFIQNQINTATKNFKPAQGAGMEPTQQAPKPATGTNPDQRQTVMPPPMQ